MVASSQQKNAISTEIDVIRKSHAPILGGKHTKLNDFLQMPISSENLQKKESAHLKSPQGRPCSPKKEMKGHFEGFGKYEILLNNSTTVLA